MLRSKKFIKKSGEENLKKFKACHIRMYIFIVLEIIVNIFRITSNRLLDRGKNIYRI